MSGRRHVTIIDVGSKQSYIFATNKQILSVGASFLVKQATTVWAEEVLADLDVDEAVVDRTVLRMSGRLVGMMSPDQAKALIKGLTERALDEASGLDIWGVVDPTPLDDDGTNLPARLDATYAMLAEARAGRIAPNASGQAIPHVARCAFTDGPAAHLPAPGAAGDTRIRSASIQLQWEAGRQGRRALAQNVDSHNRDAVVSIGQLVRDALPNEGWVGVIKADGNGLGQIFSNLSRAVASTEYWQAFAELSGIVDRVTWQAFNDAVAAVEGWDRLPDYPEEARGWLLPLIVGGDDLTVVADGRLAWAFATEFGRAFERAAVEAAGGVLAARLVEIATVLEKTFVDEGKDVPFFPKRLTFAMGLAYVKPHFPFAHAVGLAEDLEKSAKTLKAFDVSTIDFHVYHDSGRRSLTDVRDDLVVRHPSGESVAHWAGPLTVGASPDPRANEQIAARDSDVLIDLARRLVDREVSGSFVHELRASCLAGPAAVDALFRRVESRADLDGQQRVRMLALREHVTVQDTVAGTGNRGLLGRVVSAIDLADVTEGRLDLREQS